MKKVFYLFFITIFVTTLTSCTAESEDTTQDKLVKKIIELNQDGTSSTFNFTYNGEKIISIESEETSKKFTYFGNLITQIIELNKTTQVQTTFDYFYTNNLLTKVISSDNYTLNYTHQADGTIAYEKTTIDSNSNIVLLFKGTIYMDLNNIVNDKKTFETNNTKIVSKEELNFSHDSKRNPFYNIVGFAKLLDYSKIISVNNATSFIEVSSMINLETEQITSSLRQNINTFKYNNFGYPEEIISDKFVFENQKQNHLI